MHKNRVQSPKEYFTPPRWPPFLCLRLQHGRRDVIRTRSIGYSQSVVELNPGQPEINLGQWLGESRRKKAENSSIAQKLQNIVTGYHNLAFSYENRTYTCACGRARVLKLEINFFAPSNVTNLKALASLKFPPANCC